MPHKEYKLSGSDLLAFQLWLSTSDRNGGGNGLIFPSKQQKAHGKDTVGKSVRRNTTMTHETVLYRDSATLADSLSEDTDRLSVTGLVSRVDTVEW